MRRILSEWPAIFEGALNAANSTPSPLGTDTNYALLTLALASIKQNLGIESGDPVYR